MEKLLLERQKGDRDRLIEVAARYRFNFPFLSAIISGFWLLAANLMEDGSLIGGHLGGIHYVYSRVGGGSSGYILKGRNFFSVPTSYTISLSTKRKNDNKNTIWHQSGMGST